MNGNVIHWTKSLTIIMNFFGIALCLKHSRMSTFALNACERKRKRERNIATEKEIATDTEHANHI